MTLVDVAANPFLGGGWAPVRDEIDDSCLEVHGAIPDGLSGLYVRNGANPAFTPVDGYHLFMGDGMLHGVWLDRGKARYRNRYVQTKGLTAEQAVGRALYSGASTMAVGDPDMPTGAPGNKNPANTHVIRHAGKLLALCEAGLPYEMTPELDTVGEHDFGGRLRSPMTAHPKVDPVTGELLFFGYSPFPPYLQLHVADADGTLLRSEVIDLPVGVMMHDFACTDRSIVLLDAPAVMDVMNPDGIITWQPDRGARIGVMPRHGGNADVIWVEIDPCYVFHFMNAWQDGDVVVVDACRMAGLDFSFGTDGASARQHNAPTLHRFTVDTAARTAKVEQLADETADFPRVDDRRAGLRTTYGYAAAVHDADAFLGFDSVVRYDLDRGTHLSWPTGVGRTCGEPVFVPHPDGTAEDDGWVLSLVTDAATATTDLVVLDAADIAAGPVATIHLRRRVPSGFHGSFIPAD